MSEVACCDEKHECFDIKPIKHKYIKLDRFKANMAKRCNFLPMRSVRASADVPASASLVAYCPRDVYNQGALGSCTANTIAYIIKMHDPKRNTPQVFDPSRLFIYTMTLHMARPGQPLQDLGANAADGFTLINSLGVCPEADMPYDMDPVTKKVRNFGQWPTAKAYASAAQNKYPLFSNVTNNGPMLATIRTLIANNEPVALAFLVYPSFESAEVTRTGKMPMPNAADLANGPIGGHEVTVVGYDANSIRILNSWGEDWGQKGYFDMPNEYLAGSAKDGNYVMQLLTMGSIRDGPGPVPPPGPDPTPVPPGPGPEPVPPGPGPAVIGIAQIRAQIAFLSAQLAVLDGQLKLLPQ